MNPREKSSETRRKRLDPLVAKMYADYQGGMTLGEVGRKHGGRTGTDVYHLFKNRSLPRRTKHLHRCNVRGGLTNRARLDALVGQMHADYMRPMTLHAVGRKYGRTYSCVRELFTRRGLYTRPFKIVQRQVNGSPMPYIPQTDAQINELIDNATEFAVPRALKFEWRRWTLERRAAFVRRLRTHFNRDTDRPETPFSANVEPFEYGTPRAHEIAQQMNAGRSSRGAAVQMMISSQGVIYKGRLYFWAPDRNASNSGAYYIGPWRPGTGRPALHRIIWEEHNGRAVPKGHVVRHLDGNPNNLAPENLTLGTRNEVCRENQAAALLKKSRETTKILLNRSQAKTRHVLSDRLLASPR